MMHTFCVFDLFIITADDKPTPQTEENVNTNNEGMYLQVNITDNQIFFCK